MKFIAWPTSSYPNNYRRESCPKLGAFLENSSSSQKPPVIYEFAGYAINKIYDVFVINLPATKLSLTVERLKVSQAPQDKNLWITPNKGNKVIDIFEGIKLKWESFCKEKQLNEYVKCEIKLIELNFSKTNMDKLLSSYLPYVLERSEAIREENKVLKLHSYGVMGIKQPPSIRLLKHWWWIPSLRTY